MTSDPWTLYWQSGHAHSCIAAQSDDDIEVVTDFWTGFATTLTANSSVLDLATGNGTVPAMLLRANAELEITGVDRAEIDPAKHLEDAGAIGKVAFQGTIDIGNLPFDDATFNAVTSQFGIEYAILDAALDEAARVLRSGGQLGFLLHHVDSGVVGPAKARRAEMNALLSEHGVVERLTSFAAGGVKADQLEAAGQAHLSSELERTAQVTGQVFAGVNQVVELLKAGRTAQAQELCAVMSLRLTADRDRLQMLDDAALDEREIQQLVARLGAAGIVCNEPAVLRARDDAAVIIGWTVTGTRAA